VLNVSKGTVSVAPFPGETATIATLTVGYVTNQNSDSTVKTSTGVTLTTVTQTGGVFQFDSSITTFTQTGGTSTAISGTITTLNLEGGTLYFQSSGAITNWKIYSGATLDFSQNNQSRTLTNKGSIYSGSSLQDPNSTVTFSAGFQTIGCGLQDCKINVGVAHSFTVT